MSTLRYALFAVLLLPDLPALAAPAPPLSAAPAPAACARGGNGADDPAAARPRSPSHTWPIPVPRSVVARDPADLRGSLVAFGDAVVQIERIQWQRTPDGSLMPSWIQGYDPDRGSVRLSWPRPGALESSSPTALPAPRVRLPDRTIVLIDALMGTDAEGFLTFRDLSGTVTSGGQTVVLHDVRVPTIYPCGLTQEQSCRSRGCSVGGCGDAPACACSSGIGGCDPVTRTWCDGTCDLGFRCTTSVSDCRCESETPRLGDGASATIGKETAVDLQADGPGVDPSNSD